MWMSLIRWRLALVLFASIVLAAGSSPAQTIAVTYSFTNFFGNVPLVRALSIQPIALSPDNGSAFFDAAPTNLSVATFPGLTNGSVTIPQTPGFVYSATFSTPYGVSSVTSSYPDSLTGAVNAVHYSGVALNLQGRWCHQFAYFFPPNGTASVTSSNGSVTIVTTTNGTGGPSFDLSVVGGGGGQIVAAGTNIVTSVSGSTVTVSAVVGHAEVTSASNSAVASASANILNATNNLASNIGTGIANGNYGSAQFGNFLFNGSDLTTPGSVELINTTIPALGPLSAGSLFNLNASALASGTVPLARLSGITSNQFDAATWNLATNLTAAQIAAANGLTNGPFSPERFKVSKLDYKRLFNVGHSLNTTLYASGGAPYSLSANWSVPGGYSNSVAVLCTNGINYFLSGGYYPTSNISLWILATNLIANNTGYIVPDDQSCATPGITSAHIFGAPAGTCAYIDQNYIAISQTFNAAGTNTQNVWDGYTNAFVFGDTNIIKFTLDGVSFTNPFYLTGVTNFADPQFMFLTPSNAAAYHTCFVYGTPNALVKLFTFGTLAAGYQGQWMPPYAQNAAAIQNPAGDIGPMNYLLTNSPASNGIPGNITYLGIVNDWNGTVINPSYIPSPAWTNYLANCQWQRISNGLSILANAGWNVTFLTEPMAPAFIGTSQSNGVFQVNNIALTNPSPNFATYDFFTASFPYSHTSSLYIDGTHPSIALGVTNATEFVNAFGTNTPLPTIINLNAAQLIGTLPAAQFPALTGDVTTSAGSAVTSLKATGTAGTYIKTTFDSAGRETSGTGLSTSDLPALPTSVTNGVAYTNLPTAQTWPGTNNMTNAANTFGGTFTGTVNVTGGNPVTNNYVAPLVFFGGMSNSLGYETNSTSVEIWGYPTNANPSLLLLPPAMCGSCLLTNGSLYTLQAGSGVWTAVGGGGGSLGPTNLALGVMQVNTANTPGGVTNPASSSSILINTNGSLAFYNALLTFTNTTSGTTNILFNGTGSSGTFTSVIYANGVLDVNSSLTTVIASAQGVFIQVPLGGGNYISCNGNFVGILKTLTCSAAASFSGAVTMGSTLALTNGINSVGSHIPAAVTVGASPFSFTNQTPVALHMHILDAAAYSVTLNGVSIVSSFTGPYPDVLQPTNIWTITYLSTAPTLVTNTW